MTPKNAIGAALRSIYIRARLVEERLRTGVAWWPLAQDFIADPYPAYRRLRELDPVHYSILTRQIVVSRFADVDRILRDHRNFSNNLKRARHSRGIVAARKKLKPSMLALDPPDHTRLRRLVNRAFTPRSVAKLEDFIRATAHGLVDKVEGADEFDLMKGFAAPLPTIVIARMIGVPERDLDRFKVWSSRLARALEPILPPEEQEIVYRSDRQLAEYFTAIIEQRRRERRDDLISRLVEVEEQGERLTRDETYRDASPAPDSRQRDDHEPDRKRGPGPPATPRTTGIVARAAGAGSFGRRGTVTLRFAGTARHAHCTPRSGYRGFGRSVGHDDRPAHRIRQSRPAAFPTA